MKYHVQSFSEAGGPAFAGDFLCRDQPGQMRANLSRNGPELYVGTDGRRLVWAGPQQAMLVLGPPRFGKTSGLVVPNVPGCSRSGAGHLHQRPTCSGDLGQPLLRLGRCWLLDPTGTWTAPGDHPMQLVTRSKPVFRGKRPW